MPGQPVAPLSAMAASVVTAGALKGRVCSVLQLQLEFTNRKEMLSKKQRFQPLHKKLSLK